MGGGAKDESKNDAKLVHDDVDDRSVVNVSATNAGRGGANSSDQEMERRHRGEIQRLELLLRDRENICIHAKEMWMMESSRAAKLGESLERAEKKINELEKNLSELSLMYYSSFLDRIGCSYSCLN